jgi:hypothetical protein
MGRHPVIAHVPNTVRHNSIMDPRRTPMRHHPVIDTPSTVRRHLVTSHRRTVIHHPPAMAHPRATVSHRARTYLLHRLRLGCHPAMAHNPNTTCRRNTVHHRALMSGRRPRVQAPRALTVCDFEGRYGGLGAGAGSNCVVSLRAAGTRGPVEPSQVTPRSSVRAQQLATRCITGSERCSLWTSHPTGANTLQSVLLMPRQAPRPVAH